MLCLASLLRSVSGLQMYKNQILVDILRLYGSISRYKIIGFQYRTRVAKYGLRIRRLFHF